MRKRTQPEPFNALVVDDERATRVNIRDLLKAEAFAVEEAGDGATALEKVGKGNFDIVLLDIRMPKMDGLTVLRHIKKHHPHLPVIMFTAFGTSDRAIEAMKIGAFDYVTKPFDIDELVAIIHRALEHRKLSAEVRVLRKRLAEVEAGDFQPDQFVSHAPSMQKIFKMIGKVAPSKATVLIEGETGTGKELVANALWYHSTRREAPYVKVNCAAIPEGLLESELFGHEKGAFTDAHAQRKGHFEIANGGTLLLDEIAEMSPKLQSKLLRVLEQNEFQRVGGKEPLKVDVRIIAATNRNLRDEIKLGRFRKDLYYRLQVVHLVLPPLRDRLGDIPALVSHFLKKFGRKRDLTPTTDAMEMLRKYEWPGNVRELENVIERAVVLAADKFISADHLSLQVVHSSESRRVRPDLNAGSTLSLRTILANVEQNTILQALTRTRWNKTKAAKLLQIDRRVLFDKIKLYGLHSESQETDL